MKLLAALLLLMVGGVCDAAPLCLPSAPPAIRIGVTFNADGTAAGAWAYWWCGVINGKAMYEWRAVPTSGLTQSLISKLTSYSNGSSPDFINTPTAVAATDASLAPMKADIVKATAADPARPIAPPAPASGASAPVLTWKTPTAGAFTLYTAANGKLTGIVTGRKATASALCDASAVPTKSGASVYLPLIGASASEVTLCSQSK